MTNEKAERVAGDDSQQPTNIAFAPGGDHLPTKRPPHPRDAWKHFQKRKQPANMHRTKNEFLSSSSTVAGPASFAELARALKNDVDLIYEWVYSNVDFYPMFGLHKSGIGTLIDRIGNSWEQTHLMVSLLRQAGYTANYVDGVIRLTRTQIENLLGTDGTTVPTISEQFINFAQIPNNPTYDSGTGQLDHIDFQHFWVQVNIGGTNYMFDPSFKTYAYTNGIDIGSAVGYNESTLVSAAESGATVTSDYVQDLNRSNIRDAFKDYGTNLLDEIRTNHFAASTKEIIGGREIVPLSGAPFRNTTLPHQAPGFTPTVWTSMPTFYRATYQIQFAGINITVDTGAIYGRRLTLTLNGSNQPELKLDGTVIATGSTITPNAYYTATFTMTHPFSSSFADTSSTKQLYMPGTHFLGTQFGPISQEMAEFHQKAGVQNLAGGAATGSESVLGSSLAGLYYQYSAERSQLNDIYHWISKTARFIYHDWGVIRYEAPLLSPVIDLQDNFRKGVQSRVGDTATAAKVSTACEITANGFEAAIMQQNFPVTGVATPRVLDVAIGLGQKIFDTNSSNWNTGSNVRSQLTNWSSASLSNLDTAIASPNFDRVIINEDGATTIDDYVGGGYHDIQTTGSGTGVGGVITAGLAGGQPGRNAGGNPFGPFDRPRPGPEDPDPVGLFNGDLYHYHTDFSVGSGAFPYSLDFGRSYSSASRFNDGVLGKGWMHNHASSLSLNSSGARGLGLLSPKDAAAAIAHTYVMIQLALNNGNSPSLTKFLIGSLSTLWLMDQLTNNAVTVSADGANHTFIKLVDDTYHPEPIYAHTLTKNGDGTYTLKTAQQLEWNFNLNGQVETYVDPAGMTVSYTYNGSNQLTSVSNGLGRTLTFSYTSGRLTSVSDGNSRSISFAFDSNGNLTSFTDPLSRTTTYEYALPGLMSKLFLPENPTTAVTVNTFDSLGRVMTQTRTDTGVTNYYIAGSRSERVDTLNSRHIMYWNKDGGIAREINALGQETSYLYDGLSRLIKTILPEGNSIELEYDNKNNILTRTMKPKPGSSLSDIVNSFTYSSTWNKPLTATDGRGNTTTFTLDATTGQLLTIERPQVGGQTPTVTLTYNSRGQMLTATDPTGVVTKNTFDTSTEKLLSTVHDFGSSPHLNLTTSFGYNSIGDVTSVTDPRAKTATFEFDDDRKLTRSTTAPVAPLTQGFITDFGYSQNNQLTSLQREKGGGLFQTFSTAYTAAGDLDSTTDPSSNVMDYVQDELSRLSQVTDAEGRTVEYLYDELDRVSSAKDPALNTQVSRTYTVNGRSETVRDALYNSSTHDSTTLFEYDGFDRLVKTTYPDSTTEQMTFDANGNVLTFTNRGGQVITMTYDVLNRKVTKSPASMPTQTMSYDLAGRLTKISTTVVSGDPTSGDFEFFYDSAGRPYQQKKPDGKTVTYALDANGNRTKLTYPDGYFVDYVFDEINRLTDIKLNGATTSALHFDYNALSNRTKLTYGNGCTADYIYENDDDLSSLVHTFVGSSVTYSYGFDKIHQVTDQLVSDSRFMFDPLASLTTSYAAANTLNQYPTVGGTSFSYNSNGCLTGDGIWTFGFDTLNHMTSASMTGVSASYLYDPMDRQGEKNVGGTKTRFLYDGLQRIVDYDGSGNLLNRFIFGTGLDEPLIQVANGGTVTYFHQDRQSSLVASTDASGAVLTRNAYGPFGETDSSLNAPVAYTGQRFDAETGLYFYKSRYYSPTLGRFLQPDPIGYAGSLHLYAYTANTPVTLRDALGLSPTSLGPVPKAIDGSVKETGHMMSPPALGAGEPPPVYNEMRQYKAKPGCEKGGGSGGAGGGPRGYAAANAAAAAAGLAATKAFAEGAGITLGAAEAAALGQAIVATGLTIEALMAGMRIVAWTESLATTSESVSRNNNRFKGDTIVYRIIDPDGSTWKYGISSKEDNSRPRAQAIARGADFEVLVTARNRIEGKIIETSLIVGHASTNNWDPPSGNKDPLNLLVIHMVKNGIPF